MSTLEIHQIPVLSDNYIWLVREPESGDCAVVDTAVAGPVRNKLKELASGEHKFGELKTAKLKNIREES